MAGFIAVVLTVIATTAVAGQDYQDYQSARPAPRYLSSSNDIKPTPVPILKQINRHNEDGSYTYGFEAADGSFKIETKSPTGEVKGKYGYTDETGKVRVVEYGANKYGFQPSGEGITVAPPTLIDESAKQIQEEPNLGYRSQQAPAPRRPAYRPAPVQSQLDYDQYDEGPAAPVYPQPARASFNPPPNAPAQYIAPIARSKQAKPSFFSGASAAPEQHSFDYTQNAASEPYFKPAPQQYSQSLYTQASRQQQAQYNQPSRDEPHIQYSPAIFPQNQPQPVAYSPTVPRSSGGRASLLDQLIKDFALPPGGSPPLHDITFGSY